MVKALGFASALALLCSGAIAQTVPADPATPMPHDDPATAPPPLPTQDPPAPLP